MIPKWIVESCSEPNMMAFAMYEMGLVLLACAGLIYGLVSVGRDRKRAGGAPTQEGE